MGDIGTRFLEIVVVVGFRRILSLISLERRRKSALRLIGEKVILMIYGYLTLTRLDRHKVEILGPRDRI